MSSFKHNIGDKVSCLIYEDKGGDWLVIPPKDKDMYDQMGTVSKHTFEVIGRHQRHGELVLAVPSDFDPHQYLAFRIYQYFQVAYDVDQKWDKHKAILIKQEDVYNPADLVKPVVQIHLKGPGGMTCNVCNNWKAWAGPNLPNGGFACYNCRTTNKWQLDSYLRGVGIDPKGVKF